jgi:hypothetical protein
MAADHNQQRYRQSADEGENESACARLVHTLSGWHGLMPIEAPRVW